MISLAPNGEKPIFIHWKDSLELGNDLIDTQHRILVLLCRKLDIAIKRKVPEKILLSVILELRKFVEFHFISEENLMREIAYPDVDEHASKHTELLLSLSHMLGQISRQKEFPDQLLTFISDWLEQHILQEDLKIAEFVQQSKQRPIGEDLYEKYLLSGSVTDRLTGLYNRLRLDQALENEYKRIHRSNQFFSIIFVDVDHFKFVNDHHGHQLGDQVLIAIAHLLKGEAREVDVVGRWGGEEFLIVCPNTDTQQALILAERLRSMIAMHSFPSVKNKTCSFGVATIRPEETIASLLSRADAALYRAKANGRDRVESD